MTKTKKNTTLEVALDMIKKMESDLRKTKILISKFLDGTDSEIDLNDPTSLDKLLDGLNPSQKTDENLTIVEWVFDGYFMIGTDKKKYPVPMNYSSKTKLIPGDVLKLRIMNDGKLIYKLISQANRSYLKASLSKSDENKFTAITDDGNIYFLNQAAVSYYKAQTWNSISIIINGDGVWDFAAIEAVIH